MARLTLAKILTLLLFFYFLVLLQTSFFVHFKILAWISPGLVLILVILLNFFEKVEEYYGIFGAVIYGFFWDIFSVQPLGFHLLILLGLSIFIKIIIKRYARFPVFQG